MKPSWSQRFRYWFDNTMTKGPVSLIRWLALLSVLMILIISLIVWLIGIDSNRSLPEQIWFFVMLTLEPDAMTFGHWSFRLATLAIVLTSIFVLSSLIGILTTGIEGKLNDLRKGRSMVIESGHTVLLGWSPHLFPVLSQLVVANENQPRSCIVVLGDKDKVEMEEEIRARVGGTGRTRIVCRRGSPMEMGDLDIASLNTSKSIIILPPLAADPDSFVIKILLAITKNPQHRAAPYHIVAGICNPRNLEVARIVAQAEAEFILIDDLVARIAAQTCRQSGLSVIYSELMDFAGDEVYFQAEPALVGKTFGDALLAYEDSAVIGLKPNGGNPRLNPPMETLIHDGDQIIAISEDDDTVRISGLQDLQISEDDIRITSTSKSSKENTLILGWNECALSIINELDHYVSPGSTATVVADFGESIPELQEKCAGLENLRCLFEAGDTTDRQTLERLNFEGIDHVVLLCYSDVLETQEADACTLITLLHLRDIADTKGYSFSIVSEILDIRNRQLAEAARPDDFIVSDRLVSLVLSQISENKALGPVFADLFSPQGSEIYLKPVTNYVNPGKEVNFYTIAESARRRNEVAIGYRLQAHAHDLSKSYGVVINPSKSSPVRLTEDDKIIVLAEEF
jgi:voltage-gated potassium channel Kch